MQITQYNQSYPHQEIEKKWQARWDEDKTFAASNESALPKYYALIEIPYTSAQGLHVGHPRPFVGLDVIARKRRMDGFNVLYPIGWDAFGLPTENYAIKNHIHPAIVTQNNIDHYRRQLKSLGISFDYSREINTSDPGYYRWTQWIFLQLYKNGLAYKAGMSINWCPFCYVGLANEEAAGGVCERCGGKVIRRQKSQWMLRMTAYAQKLLDGLDQIDFPERVKAQQRHWIGRSEGLEISFAIPAASISLPVFTTRPDTIFGVTYLVISPEHPVISQLLPIVHNPDEVAAYRDSSQQKSDFERTETTSVKTGVPLAGITAVNPANGQEIPVWVSDYVLMSYGTGAIMAVPAHDERDWAFAHQYHLPVREVVAGGNIDEKPYTDTENGILVNSGFLNGLPVSAATGRITEWLTASGCGRKKVHYKLRDWVFSRQRYWGEPIPMVFCDRCGWVPLPESELPLLLPYTDQFLPTAEGESPLARLEDWVHTVCPDCGGPALRETDTMPQWAGSSWYFLRYADPFNSQTLADPALLKYWLPVDWYNGGMEHTTLHLLYSRFWHHFLYDIGVVTASEPFAKRTSHGMILGANHEKISKSRGNVINPDDLVAEFGADAFRTYEMFVGVFDQATVWSTQGLAGCRRFLERVWRLPEYLKGQEMTPQRSALLNRTIKKVSGDYENMKFNTAIAALMSLANTFIKTESLTRQELRIFLILLNPVAPHITEEMWQILGFGPMLARQKWPSPDAECAGPALTEIAVQINGKIKARIEVPVSASAEEVSTMAKGNAAVAAALGNKETEKTIYVAGRLLRFNVK
jgi:leucyl-tRNA synthetase